MPQSLGDGSISSEKVWVVSLKYVSIELNDYFPLTARATIFTVILLTDDGLVSDSCTLENVKNDFNYLKYV